MENNIDNVNDKNYLRNFIITFVIFLAGLITTCGAFFFAMMVWGENSSLNFLAETVLSISSIIIVVTLVWFIKSEWGFHLKNLPRLLMKFVLPVFCLLLVSYGLLLIW